MTSADREFEAFYDGLVKFAQQNIRCSRVDLPDGVYWRLFARARRDSGCPSAGRESVVVVMESGPGPWSAAELAATTIEPTLQKLWVTPEDKVSFAFNGPFGRVDIFRARDAGAEIDSLQREVADLRRKLAAERESCAKLVEETEVVTLGSPMAYEHPEDATQTLRNAASAIRVRGEPAPQTPPVEVEPLRWLISHERECDHCCVEVGEMARLALGEPRKP